MISTLLGVIVNGESEPEEKRSSLLPFQPGGDIRWGGIHHIILTYSVLIDDPQKRARERERTELTQRLNRIAKQQQSKAKSLESPQPAPQNAPPQFLSPPGPMATSTEPNFLPGASGEGPLEKAARWSRNAEAVGWNLVSRGNDIEKRIGSNNSPSKEEREAFLREENQWRLAMRYQLNWSIDNAPSKAVQDLKQLLEDPSKPGPKLDLIRVHLGG